MISEELQRKLRDKYNYEGSELRLLQNHLLILLDYFDDLCKRNNIKYWLSSGTCLGAVRHGGFVPWDDDIDVEMLREDYDRLLAVFKENEHFVLQTYQNDLFFTEPFPKLRLKNTFVNEGCLTPLYKNRGIFLDVFIMEPSKSFVAKVSHFILGSLRHISYRYKNPTECSKALFKLLKGVSFGIVNVMRVFRRLSHNNELRHTIGTGVVENIRQRKDIFPLKEILFEGKLYPVPGNIDSYLRRMYGNYMELPQTIHTHSLKEIRFLPEADYLTLRNKCGKQ